MPPTQIQTRFRVTVLGPFEVWREEKALGAAGWQRSVQTLLKLLVTSPDRRRLRDEVIDLLWPDASPEAGASNVRYVLHLLRTALGGDDPSPILADRTWISLNPAYPWEIDLVRFEELTRRPFSDREAREELTTLYRGEPLVEDRYEDWAAPLRTHLQRTWQETCRRVAEVLAEEGELEVALEWLERALAADPVDEVALRQVLSLLIQLGRRPQAARRLREFEGALRSELDLEPSPETRALLSQKWEPRRRDGGATTEPTVSPRGAGELEQHRQALPIGAYLGTLPAGTLVGRQEELSRLLTAVGEVGEGRSKLIVLAGEPGVGKTRLAQEATRVLAEQGFMVATGRCYEPDQVVPYAPFLDVLDELVRLAPPSVREEVPSRWPALVRLLPELDASGREFRIAPLDGGSQDEPFLLRSVAGFLGAIAMDHPVAILLDDLHWSDSASVKLLLYLARHGNTSRFFLLGTYRDREVTYRHPLYGALVDLGREALVEKIALHRLDLEATRALIAEVLNDPELPPGLVEIIHRPSEGNPFFVGEVVRAMIEGGDLFRSDGRWERRHASEIRVPESVRAVIGQRLSRLAPDTQDVLRAASVLGQTFRFSEAEQVSGLSEAQVEIALDEAIHAGLARETQPELYAFSHALAQQAVYEELSGRKQRRLHLMAAETLEAQPDREHRAAEIASHFLRADARERAIPYSIVAADAATRVFAHTEAEGHYRSALEAAHGMGSSAHEAEVREKLAGTLLIRGEYAEAQDHARQAVSLYGRLQDRDGKIRATNRLAELLQAQGKQREALDLVRTALAAHGDAAPSHPLAQLQLQAARLAGNFGEYERALASIDGVGQMAKVLDDQQLMDEMELERQGWLWMMGKRGEVLSILREMLRLAQERDDPWRMLWVLPALSAVSLFHGDLFGVQRYAEQQVEIARRVGDRASVAQAVSSMGNAQFLLGDWRRARANLEDGLELARSIDNVQIESFSLFDLGHLTVEEGDWETGERCLHEALQKCLQSGDLLPIRLAHLYLAYLDQARGDPHAVIERLTPLLDRSGHEEFSAIPLLPPLAQAYLDLGDVDRADDIASDALRRTSRQRNRLDLFASMVVRAGVLDAQDRREEAQGTLRKALDLAREMSFLPGQAHALFRWGVVESRRGDDEAARSYLREARDIYQCMGARKNVEMVDEALGKMPLAR